MAASQRRCCKGCQWVSFKVPPDPAVLGAADRQHLSGGPDLRTPVGVLCLPPDWAARYVVPPIGGTVYGASFWRHCVPPPDPAAVMSRRAEWCRPVRCRRSAARFFGGTVSPGGKSGGLLPPGLLAGRAGMPACLLAGRGMDRRQRSLPAGGACRRREFPAAESCGGVCFSGRAIARPGRRLLRQAQNRKKNGLDGGIGKGRRKEGIRAWGNANLEGGM